jgi:hypothetical protein
VIGGFAALAFSWVPRASGTLTYGVVTAAHVWQAVGALAGAPRWPADLSPFAHVGLPGGMVKLRSSTAVLGPKRLVRWVASIRDPATPGLTSAWRRDFSGRRAHPQVGQAPHPAGDVTAPGGLTGWRSGTDRLAAWVSSRFVAHRRTIRPD